MSPRSRELAGSRGYEPRGFLGHSFLPSKLLRAETVRIGFPSFAPSLVSHAFNAFAGCYLPVDREKKKERPEEKERMSRCFVCLYDILDKLMNEYTNEIHFARNKKDKVTCGFIRLIYCSLIAICNLVLDHRLNFI